VPTAAPIATRSGETWVLTDGRAFELYRFVDGRSFSGSREEVVETARALARFHQAAAEYPARGSFNPVTAQFAIAAPEIGGSERMDDPEVMAAAFEGLARDEPALGYAVEQARRLTREYGGSVYGALPRWLIHGDYHPGNLLYADSGKLAGVFDLDWACEHTRSRDLADGVYYIAARRDEFDGSSIESMTEAVEPDMDDAVLFLRTYSGLAPLEPEEVRAIPLALRARWLAERLGVSPLSGAEATESVVRKRLAESRLVHLATHGYAYSTEAWARQSFVALAPDDENDGLLTVGEILDDPALELEAELVVLSACQTGLGDLKEAEGTVGLQRAFLAKGARSVLVSLWSVSDVVTEELMRRFYTHWLEDEDTPSKAEALRRAQEEIRRTPGWEHPRFWAGFQLVGAS